MIAAPAVSSGGAIRRGGPGTTIVIGILLLALALATFAIWFQWSQTRRCLAFYGADVAWSIQSAPRVELWKLGVDSASGRVIARERADVSTARGLVHLRRGLVEDANFSWAPRAAGRQQAGDWSEALAFFAAGEDAVPAAVVAIDVGADSVRQGALTVVGRAGRVGLGRIGRGLRTWIESTRAAAPEAARPVRLAPP
jgi:hypothetical protein